MTSTPDPTGPTEANHAVEPRTPEPQQRSRVALALGITVVVLLVVAAALGGYLLAGRDKPTTVAGDAPTGTQTTTGPAPTTGAPAPPDAGAVLAKLTAAGLPLTNGSVQDENTDPNNLLGRPNGYVSRAAFDVPGGDTSAEPYNIDRGGVIEVWPDTASAKARSDHIQGMLKDLRLLGTEFHYLAGPVLVRITGDVKPSTAASFGAAVATLK